MWPSLPAPPRVQVTSSYPAPAPAPIHHYPPPPGIQPACTMAPRQPRDTHTAQCARVRHAWDARLEVKKPAGSSGRLSRRDTMHAEQRAHHTTDVCVPGSVTMCVMCCSFTFHVRSLLTFFTRSLTSHTIRHKTRANLAPTRRETHGSLSFTTVYTVTARALQRGTSLYSTQSTQDRREKSKRPRG